MTVYMAVPGQKGWYMFWHEEARFIENAKMAYAFQKGGGTEDCIALSVPLHETPFHNEMEEEVST